MSKFYRSYQPHVNEVCFSYYRSVYFGRIVHCSIPFDNIIRRCFMFSLGWYKCDLSMPPVITKSIKFLNWSHLIYLPSKIISRNKKMGHLRHWKEKFLFIIQNLHYWKNVLKKCKKIKIILFTFTSKFFKTCFFS